MAKITRTKSNKFHAYVYMGKDADGKRIIKSITDTDRRVVAKEVERLERMRDGDNTGFTFSSAMSIYLDEREAVLSPSTIRGYKSIERVLKSRYGAFCGLYVHDIGKRELQAVVNRLFEDGASTKRIKNIMGFVGAVLRHYDYQVPNFALPDTGEREQYEPTIEDIRKLREAVSGTELDIPVRLGLHGLRQGEICALRYPDDFADKYISVTKSMVEHADWTYSIKPPKNATSNRRVPIFDNTLIADIKKQGYVTDLLPDNLGYRFASLIKKKGLPPIRFHDLRHYFASYLHHKGVPDALILKFGGWKTDNVMKRVYRYALDDEETVSKIRDTLSDGFNYVV